MEGVSPKADIYRDNICPDMHTDAKQLMRTWVNMTQRLCGIAGFVICMFCVLLMPIAYCQINIFSIHLPYEMCNS